MNPIYTSLKNDSTEPTVAAGKKAKDGKLLKRMHSSLASASLAVSAAVAMASSHQTLASEAAPVATSYQVGASGSANTPDSLLQASESEINAAQSNVVDQATDTNGDVANLTAGLDDTAKNTNTSGNAAGTGTSGVKATRLLGSSADTGGSSQLLGAGLLGATAATTAFGGQSQFTTTLNGRDQGDSAQATGINSVAVGLGTLAGAQSTAVGTLAEAGIGGVSIGFSAVTVNGVVLGNNSTASGNSAVAIGTMAKVSGTGSVGLGYAVAAAGDYSIAVGAQSKAPAAGSIALGYSSVADRSNTVSVGSSGAERQITNVQAGTALTDAVNVAQLNSLGLVAGTTAFGLANGSSATDRTDTTAAAATGANAVAFGRGSLSAFNGVAVGTLWHAAAVRSHQRASRFVQRAK